MTLVVLKDNVSVPVSGDIVQWKDDYLNVYDSGILKGSFKSEFVIGYANIDQAEFDLDTEDEDEEDERW